MKNKEKTDYNIQIVSHALDVMEQFLDNRDELSITELSHRLGLSKNNTFRLLATLKSRNYIEQSERRAGYRLGYKNLQLGYTIVRQMTIHRQSISVLESTAKESGETTDIAILRGAHTIYLDAVETCLPVRVVPRRGLVIPAYCTAAGKVLLAGEVEKDEGCTLLTEFKQFTPKTITDRHKLMEHLEQITAQGFAIEDEELDMGVRGVAAPICNFTGRVVGAVSIYGPATRFSRARMQDELASMVTRAGEEISGRLGFSPYADGSNRDSVSHLRHLPGVRDVLVAP
jgi:DNA-binding IclR family transcriptional regulator